VDCLAAESKSVEAKLQVLTAALAYYTDLRPSHDATAAEADALGHYLFMYVLLKHSFVPHTRTTVLRSFSVTTRVSQCQKRTYGLYDAREN